MCVCTRNSNARATELLMLAHKQTNNVRNRTTNGWRQPDCQSARAGGPPMHASNPLDHARAELVRPDMHPAGPPMCARDLQCAHATGPPIRTHNKTTNARATGTAIHAQPDCQCARPTDHHCVQTPGLPVRAQPNRHGACVPISTKWAPNRTANAAHIGQPTRARNRTTNKRVQPTTNARTCGDRRCARATGTQMRYQNRTVNVHAQPSANVRAARPHLCAREPTTKARARPYDQSLSTIGQLMRAHHHISNAHVQPDRKCEHTTRYQCELATGPAMCARNWTTNERAQPGQQCACATNCQCVHTT